MRSAVLRTSIALCATCVLVACGSSSSPPTTLVGPSDASTNPPNDSPEYTSQAPAGASSGTFGAAGNGKGGASPTSASGPTDQASAGLPLVPGASSVPGGRVADVQEADVYKVSGGKLFLLNTYRGFLIYDISNPKAPVRLGHLPVYGYPVEMFVENNTVYALLSDALYLTQIGGQLQFQRRNSSQIVTIDISDAAHPKLLQAQDLAGQLREGVSRKIENTIYVVSYQPAGYWYYGWGPQNGQQPSEQAWVYSFDASQPSNLKQVGKLKIFEGGSSSSYDPKTGESHGRYSNGVTLSATANAIMVVQNWSTYDSVPPVVSVTAGADAGIGMPGCWSSRSDQQSVVSVVDVSDPSGVIQVAATFSTPGALTDQFKQTYVYDAQANTGTYLGIFARNQWLGTGCNYTQQTQNTLESWNLNGDGTATMLSSVDFGKPNETVRGSSFDVDRKVAFAITAQSMDPMYAISFADRTKLTILSAIDGLSGDMDLFLPVEQAQYLLAVGRDTGAACSSYVGGGVDGGGGDAGKNPTSTGGQIAVSLIDVRDLSKIRLVQRKCLDIANAGWISSQVTWNLDQAHKMIGLESDGTTNVLTVPISYSVQDSTASNGWYYYRYETAVGMVSWDLTQYRDTLPPEQQNVIVTHGHFVHPNGEVNRSVVYLQGPTQQREMLNISDSYLSFANIQNLDAPALDSVVEVASADQSVFRFGDYVVQQVALPASAASSGGVVGYVGGSPYEFRVKSAGGELDDAPVLASFIVGQVEQVIRHGNQLVMFRPVQSRDSDGGVAYATQVLVYDLSNPLAPAARGTTTLPSDVSPYASYYRYYCGAVGYAGGYYFGYTQGMATVDDGIAFLVQNVNYQPQTRSSDGGVVTTYTATYTQKLAFLDLRDPAHPQASEQPLALPGVGGKQAESASVVADGMATDGFYITYRIPIDSSVDPTTNATLTRYASYAQRLSQQGGAWSSDAAINIPGPLARTWGNAKGQRLFLTRDDVYTTQAIDGGGWQWIDTVTLNLLAVQSNAGVPRAALLDQRTFDGMSPEAMVYDGDRIYLVISDAPNFWGYVGGPGIAVSAPVGVGVASSGGTAVGGASGGSGGSTQPAADASDRLAIIDTSAGTLASSYEQPTELTNLDLMGAAQNRLFVNLQGDGILVVDVTSASAPKALSFYRTLGWASGIEFAGGSAYVPANNYGTYRLDLNAVGTFQSP